MRTISPVKTNTKKTFAEMAIEVQCRLLTGYSDDEWPDVELMIVEEVLGENGISDEKTIRLFADGWIDLIG